MSERTVRSDEVKAGDVIVVPTFGNRFVPVRMTVMSVSVSNSGYEANITFDSGYVMTVPAGSLRTR